MKTTTERQEWFIGTNNPLHNTDVLDEKGGLVARCTSRDVAVLLVAAPELLAALRIVRDALADASGLKANGELRIADAAISKAERRP